MQFVHAIDSSRITRGRIINDRGPFSHRIVDYIDAYKVRAHIDLPDVLFSVIIDGLVKLNPR